MPEEHVVSVGVSFPGDFLSTAPSMGDIPTVKLWGARFFIRQLSTLWTIKVPAGLPERFVFASLLDAIFGEVFSSSEALARRLKLELKSKGLKQWKYEVMAPYKEASKRDNWLWRIKKLRNQGLHGNWETEQIRIGGSPSLDMRLQDFPSGIMTDASLPEDLAAVCDKMEELIRETSLAVDRAVSDKLRRAADPNWFPTIDFDSNVP